MDLALNNVQRLIYNPTNQTLIHSFNSYLKFALHVNIKFYTGYLMLNPFYTYILDMISKHIL